MITKNETKVLKGPLVTMSNPNERKHIIAKNFTSTTLQCPKNTKKG